VELGPRLAAARRSRGAAARDGGRVQLTGRSATDQIVVFDGTPGLEGTLVAVTVRAAHGLTIFADVAKQ